MSKKMPTITATTMIEFLSSHGFEQVRQNGSHKFFKHPDGRTATVPDHKGDDLGRGITKKILTDAEMTREYFQHWLH
jgi:predicted RNA binding protein YcfA (HicA-like mRNA interferase family)